MTQKAPDSPHYYGLIQNNTRVWVDINEAVVTLFDTDGEIAAIAGIYNLAPSIISPGGHALVHLAADGEFVSEFTFEARFGFELGTDEDDLDFQPKFYAEAGDGLPLQVDSATIRGDAILAEFTNPWESYEFDGVWAYSACFADDGSILDINQTIVELAPYKAGDGDRVAFELRSDIDCTNFIVTAEGSAY